jgi:hypothetical protein
MTPNMRRVSNVGRCDTSMKEVQPPFDKHEKLNITGVVLNRSFLSKIVYVSVSVNVVVIVTSEAFIRHFRFVCTKYAQYR